MSDVPDTLAMGRRPRGEPEDGEEPVVDAALAEELVARAVSRAWSCSTSTDCCGR
jgi:hypothetical protein